MMRINTLIVEDETPARQWLRRLCAKHRDLEIIGECATVRDAARSLRSVPTDLMLLDVHLGPHSGFQVFEDLPSAAVPLVILVTAHEQYALRAFDRNAVDYVLKPVREDRLQVALERARRRLAGGLPREIRAEIQSAMLPLQQMIGRSAPQATSPRLIAERDGCLQVLDVRDIALLESDDNHVRVQAHGKEFATRNTLQALTEMLASPPFLRVNRSTVINTAFVERIEREADAALLFVLADGRRVRVGRSYHRTIADLIRAQGFLRVGVAAPLH